MTIADIAYLAFYVIVLMALAKPLGLFMMAVFEGRRTFLHPVLRPVEAGIYRISGIDENREQDWKRYTVALLAFNILGFLLLYFILRSQGSLPLNPQDLPGLKPSLAFNTAVSFMTNTNWQSYGGETTMSYFSQMVGLTFQNFVSAATGMAVEQAEIARRVEEWAFSHASEESRRSLEELRQAGSFFARHAREFPRPLAMVVIRLWRRQRELAVAGMSEADMVDALRRAIHEP